MPDLSTLDISTVGIIGAGNIGSNVATVAVRAGLDVVIANSRDPETLSSQVAELGERARAATAAEAASAGDVVVVAIPLGAYDQLPLDALAGTIVLDAGNYYPGRDGAIAALDDHSSTTSGLLQDRVPSSPVVKAFNTIYSEAISDLARPTGSPERSALPIFGDDATAKQKVTELLDRLGFDVVDGGHLSESWRAENGTPIYGTAYSDGDDPSDYRPAGADVLVPLLEHAQRTDPVTS